MLEIGNTVKLTDDKNYIVANIIELHSVRYAYLVTEDEPIQILVATIKDVAGTSILEEVKDSNELDYVLNQFALTNNE